MTSNRSLLQVKIGETSSPSLTQLVDELSSLRPNRAVSPESTWMHFLLEVFRHPLTGKFERIDKYFLSHEVLLQTRLNKIHDEGLRELISELVRLNGEHDDHHAGEKLYVALNRLMCGRVRQLQSKIRRRAIR